MNADMNSEMDARLLIKKAIWAKLDEGIGIVEFNDSKKSVDEVLEVIDFAIEMA